MCDCGFSRTVWIHSREEGSVSLLSSYRTTLYHFNVFLSHEYTKCIKIGEHKLIIYNLFIILPKRTLGNISCLPYLEQHYHNYFRGIWCVTLVFLFPVGLDLLTICQGKCAILDDEPPEGHIATQKWVISKCFWWWLCLTAWPYALVKILGWTLLSGCVTLGTLPPLSVLGVRLDQNQHSFLF